MITGLENNPVLQMLMGASAYNPSQMAMRRHQMFMGQHASSIRTQGMMSDARQMIGVLGQVSPELSHQLSSFVEGNPHMAGMVTNMVHSSPMLSNMFGGQMSTMGLTTGTIMGQGMNIGGQFGQGVHHSSSALGANASGNVTQSFQDAIFNRFSDGGLPNNAAQGFNFTDMGMISQGLAARGALSGLEFNQRGDSVSMTNRSTQDYQELMKDAVDTLSIARDILGNDNVQELMNALEQLSGQSMTNRSRIQRAQQHLTQLSAAGYMASGDPMVALQAQQHAVMAGTQVGMGRMSHTVATDVVTEMMQGESVRRRQIQQFNEDRGSSFGYDLMDDLSPEERSAAAMAGMAAAAIDDPTLLQISYLGTIGDDRTRREARAFLDSGQARDADARRSFLNRAAGRDSGIGRALAGASNEEMMNAVGSSAEMADRFAGMSLDARNRVIGREITGRFLSMVDDPGDRKALERFFAETDATTIHEGMANGGDFGSATINRIFRDNETDFRRAAYHTQDNPHYQIITRQDAEARKALEQKMLDTERSRGMMSGFMESLFGASNKELIDSLSTEQMAGVERQRISFTEDGILEQDTEFAGVTLKKGMGRAEVNRKLKEKGGVSLLTAGDDSYLVETKALRDMRSAHNFKKQFTDEFIDQVGDSDGLIGKSGQEGVDFMAKKLIKSLSGVDNEGAITRLTELAQTGGAGQLSVARKAGQMLAEDEEASFTEEDREVLSNLSRAKTAIEGTITLDMGGTFNDMIGSLSGFMSKG